MKKFFMALTGLLAAAISSSAQIGGEGVYSFLELKSSARIAALGGELPALSDDDVSLVYNNPALLNHTMDQHLAFNYIPYFADIHYGYTAGAFSLNKKSHVAAGVHFVNYGEFIRANASGIRQGKFYAEEYAIQFSYSRTLIDSLLYAGVSLKPVLSNLEQYSSFGMSTDWGLLFKAPGGLANITLVARNLGMQLTSYYGNHREKLPFNLLLGYSQKLEHAPFRFNLTLHHLNKWSIRSDFLEEEAQNPFQDEAEPPRWEQVLDEGLHHLIVGTEIALADAFRIYVGYNHQRRQEMAIPEAKGLHGFSFGFDIKLKRFQISYGRATYHVAGASNHFSVVADLSSFINLPGAGKNPGKKQKPSE